MNGLLKKSTAPLEIDSITYKANKGESFSRQSEVVLDSFNYGVYKDKNGFNCYVFKGYSKTDVIRVMSLLFHFCDERYDRTSSGECCRFSYNCADNSECGLSIVEKEYGVEVSFLYCAG